MNSSMREPSREVTTCGLSGGNALNASLTRQIGAAKCVLMLQAGLKQKIACNGCACGTCLVQHVGGISLNTQIAMLEVDALKDAGPVGRAKASEQLRSGHCRERTGNVENMHAIMRVPGAAIAPEEVNVGGEPGAGVACRQ